MAIISGNGSQGNPYIVDTWSSLRQCANESGKYIQLKYEPVLTSDTTVERGKLYFDSQGNIITNPKNSGLSTYYENSFEIDLNDEYPEGVPYSTTGNPCAIFINGHIDGRGGTIRNLYCNNPSTDGFRLMHFNSNAELLNTDILNIYFVGNGVTNALLADGGNSLIRRCRVSGVLYNTNFYRKSNSADLYIERCTFSMYGNIPSCSLFSCGDNRQVGDYTLKNSVFDFTCPRIRTINSDGLWMSASNCLFTGILGFPSGEDNAVIDEFNMLSACVFDITSSSDKYIFAVNDFLGISVPCVFNTQKFPNVMWNIDPSYPPPTDLILANNSQMTNETWLLQQGFPVGRMV